MNTKITLETMILTKVFSTILTLVRFITSVYMKMFLEIIIITKSFSTVLTLIMFLQCVYEYEFGDYYYY